MDESQQIVGHYDASYGHFDDTVYRDVRLETFDEDIGQNGWITASEQNRFIEWLALNPGDRLLDIACGSGGPTLRIAEKTGAMVCGIDVHAAGIGAAQRQAAERGLTDRTTFEVADASDLLRFEDGFFDAVMCIDAINHLPNRPRILREWARVLRPGGRLLFTDPIVLTGALTKEEILIRSSVGFFLFVAPDTDEGMLADAGLCICVKEDLTEAVAMTASRWRAARKKHETALRRIEGDATYDGQQRFFEIAARIAGERRLSRFAFVATRPE